MEPGRTDITSVETTQYLGDTRDTPPAYTVSPPTHANPYHSQASTEFQYSRNTVGKGSKGRSVLRAIKGLFSIGGKKPKGATGQTSGQTPFPTPGSELSNSSRSARHPSQRWNDPSATEGYFKPLRRPTTLATEDQLEALRNYDTQFLIDDSGSMRLSTSQFGKGKTHWEEVNHVLSEIVKICAKFDENGIDVFFFNSSIVGQFNGLNIKNPNEVMKLFADRERAGIRGSTPTAEALDLIIAPYLSNCECRAKYHQRLPKPKNIIVLTDGAANNNKLLKRNLLSYARRLDKMNAPSDQIGIQFFQVGRMEGVEEFLNHLDEAMAEENDCRDFIDTRSSEDMGEEGLSAPRVLTTVLGAVNRRLDKRMT